MSTPIGAAAPALQGADFHAWRVGHDLTQDEMAERLGVTKNTVARWERGEVACPAILALALKGLSFSHGALCSCPQCYKRFGSRPGRELR